MFSWGLGIVATSRRSLRITDLYAGRLKSRAAGVERQLGRAWRLDRDDFDGSFDAWLALALPAVERAQLENVRLTAAYVSAFVLSETGRRERPRMDPADYVGVTADGSPLDEGMAWPRIRAKQVMAEGGDVDAASRVAQAAAVAMAGMDVYGAARRPLADWLGSSGVGWRRVVVGETCGACLGLADGRVMSPSARLHVHPSCDCVAEPVLGPDRFRRATGSQVFESLSPDERRAALGDEAAALVDEGRIGLSDLVSEVRTAGGNTFVKQRPVSDLPI